MYDIVYENEDFIVISKKEGFLSIKARGTIINDNTIFDELKRKYSQIYIVHRLDKDTSGIMIFAKNKESHKNISFMFQNRHVDKRYLALVWGVCDKDFYISDSPIKEFGSGRMGISDAGKISVTEFNVLKRFDKFSLIEAKPLTGRRHQIRVHLYHFGYPIVGDKLYGDLLKQKQIYRMMLHSYKLSFKYKGKRYDFVDSDNFTKEIEEFIIRDNI
ncbi:MAG: RluA family pseudouridine synthase [Elusimicrobiales bacterium]|nr:RNA pseudouridine synthase [Elusimicrobiales bacterium]